MMPNKREDRIGEWDRGQNIGSDGGVGLDRLHFSSRQGAAFAENVVGHRQLAQVVQQSGYPESFQIVFVSNSAMHGQLPGDGAHSKEVSVANLISSVHGQGQGLDGRVEELFRLVRFAPQFHDLTLVDFLEGKEGRGQRDRHRHGRQMDGVEGGVTGQRGQCGRQRHDGLPGPDAKPDRAA